MASRGQLSIYDRLRIKYGLPDNPTPQMVDSWRAQTERNVSQGYTKDAAGRNAAAYVFPGFETRVYASEGDTVDTLLTEALKK